MDETHIWIAAAAVAIFVLPPLVVALNERRMRRRERVLGARRKQKYRL